MVEMGGEVVDHVHLHPRAAVPLAHEAALHRDDLPGWVVGDLLFLVPGRGLGPLPGRLEAPLGGQVQDVRLLGGEGLGAHRADDGGHGDCLHQDAEED